MFNNVLPAIIHQKNNVLPAIILRKPRISINILPFLVKWMPALFPLDPSCLKAKKIYCNSFSVGETETTKLDCPFYSNQMDAKKKTTIINNPTTPRPPNKNKNKTLNSIGCLVGAFCDTGERNSMGLHDNAFLFKGLSSLFFVTFGLR